MPFEYRIRGSRERWSVSAEAVADMLRGSVNSFVRTWPDGTVEVNYDFDARPPDCLIRCEKEGVTFIDFDTVPDVACAALGALVSALASMTKGVSVRECRPGKSTDRRQSHLPF